MAVPVGCWPKMPTQQIAAAPPPRFFWTGRMGLNGAAWGRTGPHRAAPPLVPPLPTDLPTTTDSAKRSPSHFPFVKAVDLRLPSPPTESPSPSAFHRCSSAGVDDTIHGIWWRLRLGVVLEHLP
jgi:hypothetical protein